MSDPSSNSDPTNRVAADESPVTGWLRQLEAGNSQAAQPLYEHFCSRLQELARHRIPDSVRGAYDHDDVSNSAFHSLFLGIREQRYQLRDRTDFWRLLMTIAERKIAHRIRDESRDKRDVHRVVQNSLFLRRPSDSPQNEGGSLDSLAGHEPTPEFAAEVADTCDAMLAALPDDDYRKIALLRLENHSSDEIAAKLGCTRRTVQRKLLIIRRTWQQESGIENPESGVSQLDDERASEE